MTEDRAGWNDIDEARRELREAIEQAAIHLDRAAALAESIRLGWSGRLHLAAARRHTGAAWRKGAL